MNTDPISDMLTRIRNAQAAQKPEVLLPYSKIKLAILELMKKEGWVAVVDHVLPRNVKVSRTTKKSERNASKFDQIRVVLKYDDGNKPVISSIKRTSKPGRRVYVGKDEIPVVLNDIGVAFISTSRGVMTNRDAKKQGVGGEVICEIY